MSKKVLISGIVACAVVICWAAWGSSHRPISLGSVAVGSEYHATSTRNFNGTALTNLTVLNSGQQGTLGSLVVLGVTAGQINFYDATTSNVNFRQASMSSTTQLLATVPLSVATGTYTFDTHYENGLLIEIIGTTPTSTITFR